MIIETCTQDELDKLIACAKFGDAQMTVKEREKEGDLIYIPSVPAEVSDARFYEQFFTKNFSATSSQADFDLKMRFRKRIPAANGNC